MPEIEAHEALDDSIITRLAELDARCFAKPFSADQFRHYLEGERDLLVLLATSNGEDVGYKVGYSFVTRDTYFSFSGAVVPDHRRQGIASALLEAQHTWAKARGYEYVRTHTKNRFRSMLLLNIAAGFDVTGVNAHLPERHHTIVLEKAL